MDRKAIEKWLKEHPADVHGAPAEIVEACEREVRHQAAADAWNAAASWVEGRMHQWEEQWGFHASESSVAKETCAMLARELAKHEPTVREGYEDELAPEEILALLEPAAQEKIKEWILDLAREVEHAIWREIVRFTRKEGRTLVKEGRVSDDHSWEGMGNYSQKAAHVAELLIADYNQHARET